MESRYTSVSIPDARLAGNRGSAPHDEVRALVNVIRRGAVSADGRKPSMDKIAMLLGISERTLETHMQRPPKKRGARARGVPYLLLYALEVLASCPACVAARIWGDPA